MNPTAPYPLQDKPTGTLQRAVPTAVGAAESMSAFATDKPKTASRTEHSLTAHALLAGRPWVGIEHNGQHYRLQTTRAGKLILTK